MPQTTMKWIDALTEQTIPCVLITVAMVEGSTPREAGAKMVVTLDRQFDTIGGGHLELRAVEVAREMLASCAFDGDVAVRRMERFALGPSLGQCCGGVMHVAFERMNDERMNDERLNEFACMRDLWRNGRDSWRISALDSPSDLSIDSSIDFSDSPAIYDRNGCCLHGVPHTVPFNPARPCHVWVDANGRRWLIDPYLAHHAHLLLFGAGHVGAAIVRALADLPCRVTWVDERDAQFPSSYPANVTVEATDTPEAVIDAAAPGTSFLVMTHEHALDLRLAECILRRGDVAWFGLIGSITKRMQFERRLTERGVAKERLSRMVCPIGLADIHGKEPAVIAASVVAQLLQVWEAVDCSASEDSWHLSSSSATPL